MLKNIFLICGICIIIIWIIYYYIIHNNTLSEAKNNDIYKEKFKLFDSLSKKLKEVPLRKDLTIKIYVCGPTVYDHCHIGHGRMLITFDLLYRVIRLFSTKKIEFVQNITDIDDKIINRAKKENVSIEEISEKYTHHFLEICELLNIKKPIIRPKATEYLKQMIDYIQELLNNDKAYSTSTGIYLDTTKIPYGYFNHNEESISHNIDNKKNETDFVLWKFTNDITYESPFGAGRPGWHTECVCMSENILGKTFHIHGGGIDLKFPHHENELAQHISSNNRVPVHIWMHSELVNINNAKMSKSLGNSIFLKDFIKDHFFADVLRYIIITHHYRAIIDFSDILWEQAIQTVINMRKHYFKSNMERILKNTNINDLDNYINYINDINKESHYINEEKTMNIDIEDSHIFKNTLCDEMYKALENDLDFPRFIQLVHQSLDSHYESKYERLKYLGFWFKPRTNLKAKYIHDQCELRKNYKLKKNYNMADEIRKFLLENYIVIEDIDNNYIWYYI